jgi:hypothetical protein
MDVYSSQSELSDDVAVRTVEELKRYRDSVVNTRWSYTNNESTEWAEALSTMDRRQGMGYVPDAQ